MINNMIEIEDKIPEVNHQIQIIFLIGYLEI
jgi:hypothetical protein